VVSSVVQTEQACTNYRHEIAWSAEACPNCGALNAWKGPFEPVVRIGGLILAACIPGKFFKLW
jgi:hypothetical protein